MPIEHISAIESSLAPLTLERTKVLVILEVTQQVLSPGI